MNPDTFLSFYAVAWSKAQKSFRTLILEDFLLENASLYLNVPRAVGPDSDWLLLTVVESQKQAEDYIQNLTKIKTGTHGGEQAAN
jgi:hypothetical protein